MVCGAAGKRLRYAGCSFAGRPAFFVTEAAGAIAEKLQVPKLLGRAEIPNSPDAGAKKAELAAALINHGARLEDVQALLGHNNPGTTQVYAQVSLERKKQAYNQHFVN